MDSPVKQWHRDPPREPGTYEWRRTWQWESIFRTIPADRLIYSQRYCNYVTPDKLDGEWLY